MTTLEYNHPIEIIPSDLKTCGPIRPQLRFFRWYEAVVSWNSSNLIRWTLILCQFLP